MFSDFPATVAANQQRGKYLAVEFPICLGFTSVAKPTSASHKRVKGKRKGLS